MLLALPLPPHNVQGTAWVCLIPLLAALWLGPDRPSTLLRFGLGYAAGAVFFLLSLGWMREVTVLGWFLLCLYLAVYPALWSLVAGALGWRAGRHGALRDDSPFLRTGHNLMLGVACAAAWVSVEWLRGVVFSGFGWNRLGVGLHSNLALIQVAEFTGVAGLSFLVAMVNVVLFATVVRVIIEVRRGRFRTHFDLTLTIALVLGALVFGVRTLQVRTPAPERELRVALVQASVPRRLTWDLSDEFEQGILDRYRRLSRTAAAAAPDLIVWPEAATPRPVLLDPINREAVDDVLALGAFELLLGTLDQEPVPGRDEMRSFNTAMLFPPGGGRPQVYRKLRLVPFGEFVPLRHSFFLFRAVIGSQVPSDFTAGTEPTILHAGKPPVGLVPLICFEDTLGDLTRQFVLRGGRLLANMTNDAWFGRSPGSAQHLVNAVFRTVENRRPMIRAANTGVSCVIDVHGRIVERLADETGDTFGEGVLVAGVPLPPALPLTFYTRHGELFTFACLAATLALVLARCVGRIARAVRARRRHDAEAAP